MHTCYIFEDFFFDPRARKLLRAGDPLEMGGRAFDLLHALLRNHERVVSKEELIECVWPGAAVETNNLQVQVWTLRKRLGPRAIATVARRGYQFMLKAQAVERESRETVEEGRPSLHLALASPSTDAALRELSVDRLDDVLRVLRRANLIWLTGADPSSREARAHIIAEHLVLLERKAIWHTQARQLAQPDLLSERWMQRLLRAGGILVVHAWRDDDDSPSVSRLESLRASGHRLRILVVTATPPREPRGTVVNVDQVDLSQPKTPAPGVHPAPWGLRSA